MEFEIKVISTIEFPPKFLKVDLNKLEDFIASRIKEKNYGPAVIKYFWGFELFKFNGEFAQFFRNDIESWKHSLQWLVTNSNFDWNVVKGLNEKETFQLVKKELLESINRIENMKRKPKDFDKQRFYNDIEAILIEYIEKPT